ncbi:hypothetical protein [Marinoscillum sp.]|uniref:hypothetical protein n=1 Tax=Marinoscillum sp. TaxID=2024838 RepID=UPI003BA97F14
MKPKKLFLIDSAGAILSAFMLGVVLVRMEHIFGMPPEVLYTLSAVASLLFLYSFTCYWKVRENPRPFLQFIAIANFSYCIATLVLVVHFIGELSNYGIFYFAGEALVVMILTLVEFRTSLLLNNG